MVLGIDTQGAVDLDNNWSAVGHPRHYTKNIAVTEFEKHVETYNGKDEYESMS